MVAELEDPYILIHEKKLSSLQEASRTRLSFPVVSLRSALPSLPVRLIFPGMGRRVTSQSTSASSVRVHTSGPHHNGARTHLSLNKDAPLPRLFSRRAHSPDTNSRRITPSVCSALISDRDRFLAEGRPHHRDLTLRPMSARFHSGRFRSARQPVHGKATVNSAPTPRAPG
jgi:hypothetical protein